MHELEGIKNLFLEAVNELQASDKKLIVWGGGGTSRIFKKFFFRSGIKVDAVAVSREFYEPNQEMDGIPVEIIDDCVLNNTDCNVFIAFMNYSDDLLSHLKSYINKIYCFDVAGMCVGYNLNIFDYDWYNRYKKDLTWLYNEFFEQKSKAAFLCYMEQKMSGRYSKPYSENQYFCDEIISFEENEIFVDCGAFTGDTIQGFINNLHKSGNMQYKKIYGFEPDASTFEQAKKNLNKYDNITLINKGAWNCTDILKFNSHGSASSLDLEGTVEIHVQSIDSLVKNEKVTFIKMDIEGAELNALKGASETIKANKPKLAICVYHKLDDLHEIPRYIKSLVPEYKLYFRNHSKCGVETVLYAVI
ncbi:MAG: FkbM family methyltransferase [Defluviitaleaceae bacterium]|nr:FkbM family methyltransferase [Defluviitaleaceae bacterium]